MGEINKDGIDYKLSPYQCLILWGLWAILYLTCKSFKDNTIPSCLNNIRHILYEGASQGFVIGNINDKIQKKEKSNG